MNSAFDYRGKRPGSSQAPQFQLALIGFQLRAPQRYLAKQQLVSESAVRTALCAFLGRQDS